LIRYIYTQARRLEKKMIRKNVSGWTAVEAVVTTFMVGVLLTAVTLVGSLIYFLLTH
jgi:hypothetical protein